MNPSWYSKGSSESPYKASLPVAVKPPPLVPKVPVFTAKPPPPPPPAPKPSPTKITQPEPLYRSTPQSWWAASPPSRPTPEEPTPSKLPWYLGWVDIVRPITDAVATGLGFDTKGSSALWRSPTTFLKPQPTEESSWGGYFKSGSKPSKGSEEEPHSHAPDSDPDSPYRWGSSDSKPEARPKESEETFKPWGQWSSSSKPSTYVSSTLSPVVENLVWKPAVGSKFQIILHKSRSSSWFSAEESLEPHDADIFDLDLFDTPKETIDRLHRQGKKVICYYSAGTAENWRADYGQFLEKDMGNKLKDWQKEKWVDLKSPKVWEIMLARINLGKEKGCDGLDADNVGMYTLLLLKG
jgi:hypothetical protein